MIPTIIQAMRFMSRNYIIRELFDPIQTHAVYNVNKDDVIHVKAKLKELSATRFRIVKVSNSNLRIVCFKLKAGEKK